MTEELKQHEIKTAYVLHGERTYYIDAENPEDAEERFNKRHLHDNLVKDTVFMMEEHVKETTKMDTEVDIVELKKAERLLESEIWSTQMNKILNKSREKLRKEMGFGEKD